MATTLDFHSSSQDGPGQHWTNLLFHLLTVCMKYASQLQNAERKASEESVHRLDSEVLEKLLYHLLQWLSKNLVALRRKSVNLSSDKLCAEILPFMATLLPNLPTERHRIYLQIICHITRHMNSEMVGLFCLVHLNQSIHP